MKISTKGRYGLQAIMDIAIHMKTNEVVTVSSISERQNISKNYLEQVIAILRKAGLVKGIKGPQGGYLLGLEPSEMTLGQVLRALEGNLFEVDQEPEDQLSKIQKCINKNVWNVLDEKINEVVDHITISDLIESYKKEQMNHMMFYI